MNLEIIGKFMKRIKFYLLVFLLKIKAHNFIINFNLNLNAF